MKKLNIIPLLLALMALIVSKSYAHDKYTENMQKNIETVYSAQTIPELQQAVNALERIGDAEKTKWEPFYYAAYCYTALAFGSDKAGIDQLADQADKYNQLAEGLSKNNSEISVLGAMINSCRIMVDPVARFQIKGREVAIAIGKAKEENPDNPRIYLLEARMQMRTPEAFGGGKKPAKISIDKALEKFAAFRVPGKIAPSWGYQQAIALEEMVSGK